MLQAVVGEGLAVFREVADVKARLVLEELEFGEDAADRGGIGRPLERRRDEPRVAALGEGEGADGVAASDFQRANVGGFGAEDAAARLRKVFLDRKSTRLNSS